MGFLRSCIFGDEKIWTFSPLLIGQKKCVKNAIDFPCEELGEHVKKRPQLFTTKGYNFSKFLGVEELKILIFYIAS